MQDQGRYIFRTFGEYLSWQSSRSLLQRTSSVHQAGGGKDEQDGQENVVHVVVFFPLGGVCVLQMWNENESEGLSFK